MNSNLVKIIVALAILGGVGYFLFNKSKDKNSSLNKAVNTVAITAEDYSDYTIIPEDQLYDKSPAADSMLLELKQRYINNFDALTAEIKAAGAKMIFCWFTTERERKMHSESKEFIKKLCTDNDVEFVDFVPLIMNKTAEEITFMPKDGHLNKNGAKIMADKMAEYIKKYSDARSTKTYSEKPKIFGDLEPNQKDNILDGGKNLPYKLTTNSQGLRMNYDLAAQKTKQRILVMGDSFFYFAFLDNDQTGTGLLQVTFPDKEIINAAIWGYSVDDYWSQWKEGLKYTEPDVIFLQSSGQDIAKQFFTHRLKFSRHKELVKPTESEKRYYSSIKK
ncbi:MAG TPA: hypothetical protein VGP43_03480 [Chitinophagaceae bacterium]|nr:hypothetical protein [Chitinophagaceae bacterium]